MKSLVIALSALSCCLLAQEPQKLSSLRTNFQAAIDRATGPIKTTYMRELEKLKVEFTKAGDLQGALMIDNEVKRQLGQPITQPDAAAKPTAPVMPDQPVADALGSYVHEGQKIVLIDTSGKSLEQVRALGKRRGLALYGFEGHDTTPDQMKAAIAAMTKAKQDFSDHNSYVLFPALTFNKEGKLVREPLSGGRAVPPPTAANIYPQFRGDELNLSIRKDATAVGYVTHSAGTGLFRLSEDPIPKRIVVAAFVEIKK